MLYLIPPAGTHVSAANIMRIVRARLRMGISPETVEQDLRRLIGAKHIFLTDSGRTGLLLTLKALSDISETGRNEVVIPAYTCFSVAAAVARGSLKIRLVDIDPSTMDYQYEKLYDLDYSKILAIVACNLFGIFSDWPRLQALARDRSVFLIDDAAQSMGSRFEDRPAGSLGDVGFYSLGRGKNLSTYSGGILLTDNDAIAARLEKEMESLKRPGRMSELMILLKIVLYSLFLRPRFYWLPDKMPFLGIGETVFDESFNTAHLSSLQKCAASILYPDLKDLNEIRSRNARAMAEALLKSGQYKIPGYNGKYFPAYLRLPLLAHDRSSRDNKIIALKRQGIAASTMYPSIIQEIPRIERYLASTDDAFPGGQEVVKKLLTLPTHSYVRDTDMQRIVDCLLKE